MMSSFSNSCLRTENSNVKQHLTHKVGNAILQLIINILINFLVSSFSKKIIT